MDDAFIAARYARNLAAGLGYGINAHQPSDGVTGPLWLLPQVLACRWNTDPVVSAKVVGLGCTVLALWLLLRRLRRRSGGSTAAGASALLLAFSPSIGTWAVAGLETGAALLFATGAALAATRRPRSSPIWLGLCVASLAWLRPELALLATVLLAYAVQRAQRRGGVSVALALVGALGVTGFRLWCFGSILPLSFWAKAGSLDHGLRYAIEAVVLSTSLVGAWLAFSGARLGRRDDRVLLVALLAQLLAMVLAGGDWMPGYRLLVPVLPLYAWLAGLGVSRYALRRPRLGVLLLLLSCAVPALDLATRLPELRESARSRATAAGLADWLRTHARSVALVDIGYLGYASGIELIDLGGLTDPRIAHMPGGHVEKRIDSAYLEQRAPDAIVLHSATRPEVDSAGRLRSLQGYAVERRVAALPFVRADYRVDRVVRYAQHYYYAVLKRSSSQGAPR